MLRKVLITMLLITAPVFAFTERIHISKPVLGNPAIYLAAPTSTPRSAVKQPPHSAPPPVWHRRSEIETRRAGERIDRTADRQLEKTREMQRRQEEQRK